MSVSPKICRDAGKTEKCLVRMSREDAEMLKFASEKLGMSKSDVIRKGILMEYNLAKLRDENE